MWRQCKRALFLSTLVATGVAVHEWSIPVRNWPRLEQVSENVQIKKHYFRMFSLFALSTNMTIIYNEKDVILYNVAPITNEVVNYIKSKNPEKIIIIVPNREHMRFVAHALYKLQQTFTCPILVQAAANTVEQVQARLPEFLYTQVTPISEHKDLEFAQVKGFDRLAEVVVHHKPSETLVCCDMAFNVQETDINPDFDDNHAWNMSLFKAYAILTGMYKNKASVSRLFPYLADDLPQVQQSVATIAQQWPTMNMIMAHGAPILRDPKIALTWRDNWAKM